ncbi:MAG: PilZ domain-containing protein [Deltaproteobacteria bacterium]|jgi:hypothetical protein
MSDNHSSKKFCPYWAPDSDQPCTMTVSGLYVPLKEHIIIFCQTEQADQCPHYIRGSKLLRKAPRTRDILQEEGRRRHRRFAGRYSLILSTVDRPGVSGKQLLDRGASTIDLSIGGMKIETTAKVPETDQICFTFGDDFWLPGLAGLAEVRWRRQIETSNRYEYGLGFADSQTRKTIGESLGIMM